MRPPLRHRLTDAQWLRIDAAAAAFVAGVLRVDLPRAAFGSAPPEAVTVALVALGTLPFAARRRVPLGVLAVTVVPLGGLDVGADRLR
jgi:hypothetical protein